MKVLIIDNFDSFTLNIAQYVYEVTGIQPVVVPNTTVYEDLPLDEVAAVILSPGPGRPSRDADFGVCRVVIERAPLPILGVCLGHQGIAEHFGARTVPAPEPAHGVVATIKHHGTGLFAGLPQDLPVVRYHSLVSTGLPADLQATAWTSDGLIMALAHRSRPLWGVQFHPESLQTVGGHQILSNFMELAARHHRGGTGGAASDPTPQTAPSPAVRAFTAVGGALALRLEIRTVRHPGAPAQVFRERYAGQPYAFWLDSEGSEQGRSRYSLMGAWGGEGSVVITYDLTGRRLTLRGHERDTQVPGDLFTLLEEITGAVSVQVPADCPLPFTGGLVGYFGYELKALTVGDERHRSAEPEAWFLHTRQFAVFDHERGVLLDCALTEPGRQSGRLPPATSAEAEATQAASAEAEATQAASAEAEATQAASAEAEATQAASAEAEATQAASAEAEATQAASAEAEATQAASAEAEATQAASAEAEATQAASAEAEATQAASAEAEATQAASAEAEATQAASAEAEATQAASAEAEATQAASAEAEATQAASAEAEATQAASAEAEATQAASAEAEATQAASAEAEASEPAPSAFVPGPVREDGLRLRHGREAYLAMIKEAQRLITDGESYEICLTNRAELTGVGDGLRAYERMRSVSAVPAGAYLRTGAAEVLCSSPETFLRVDEQRMVESSPIKGTRPRGATDEEDAELRESLLTSEKDRAENLMIVDLVRHDLNAVCEPGSVHVPHAFALQSYSSVHQLVSTIRGRLRRDRSALSAVRACFPGGSMTGAPKKRTMEIIDELEGAARGIYAGALGWLSFSGTLDLNIVIRTAVVRDGTAAFGIGGAITAKSDPDEEFQETLVKASIPYFALHNRHGEVGVRGIRSGVLAPQSPTSGPATSAT